MSVEARYVANETVFLQPVPFPPESTSFVYYSNNLEIPEQIQNGLIAFLRGKGILFHVSLLPLGEETPLIKRKTEMKSPVFSTKIQPLISSYVATHLSLFFCLAERAALSPPREESPKKFKILYEDVPGDVVMDYDGVLLQLTGQSTGNLPVILWTFCQTSFGRKTLKHISDRDVNLLYSCAKALLENRDLDQVKGGPDTQKYLAPGMYI